MSFSSSSYLRRATSRAKSDVANKLVSMFLHDLSRKISAKIGLSVTDVKYSEAVELAFGDKCCYCGSSLESDRVAVEHLDGMNRFRVGLHIPGNVIVACKRCNVEKRRDDSLEKLVLAPSGWESFLSHNSEQCTSGCKNCLYWKDVWPNSEIRSDKLKSARVNISAFRSKFPEALKWGIIARSELTQPLDQVYRECQEFAVVRIRKEVEKVFSVLLER